jgi:hypothetical protein
MAALLGCWKDATSTPFAAPVLDAWLVAELMAVRAAPGGPASWLSSCGEWVAPTLDRFGGGEPVAAAADVVAAAAGGPARPARPRPTARAQAPAERRDT